MSLKHPLFTPEELEELAAYDAMVDASDITAEEIRDSRERDRAVNLESMDKKKKQNAIRQREYREANRERIRSYHREYREANRERLRSYHREYREANRERLSAWHRAYYEKNRDQLKAYQSEYYKRNRERIAVYQLEYQKKRREKVKAEHEAPVYAGGAGGAKSL